MKKIDQTKLRILHAAQYEFSRRSYSEVGVREIAARAKTNSALISRYYGSKLGLFKFALEELLNYVHLTSDDKSQFGKIVVANLLGRENNIANPQPMMILGFSDPDARQAVTDAIMDKIFLPIQAWLGGVNAADKAAHLMALTAGVFFYRQILPLDPLKGQLSNYSREWLEKALQDIIDN